MELLNHLKSLCQQVIDIARSEIPPELKYELVFSGHLSDKIRGYIETETLEQLYGYYNPDGSHEEDVQAYADAIRKLLADLVMIEILGMSK